MERKRFELSTSALRTIDDGAELPVKQGPNSADVPVCPKVCPKCCRMLTITDNSTSDTLKRVVAILQELIGENDRKNSEQSWPNINDEQAGNVLLEVIRLLTKMTPDERTALIGLLKALG